jgi:hypothetical protein
MWNGAGFLRQWCRLPSTPEPSCDAVVIHDVVGDEGCSIMNQDDSPLEVDVHLVGPGGEFSHA